jgi:hypothetical protein
LNRFESSAQELEHLVENPERLRDQQRQVLVVRTGALELGRDLRDSQLGIVDQLHARVDVTAPRLGDVELAEQLPRGSPNRSDIGTWWPNAISVEWIRFCQDRAMLDQVQAKSGALPLLVQP